MYSSNLVLPSRSASPYGTCPPLRPVASQQVLASSSSPYSPFLINQNKIKLVKDKKLEDNIIEKNKELEEKGVNAVKSEDKKKEKNEDKRHIFLFVNPTSGGNKASFFISPGVERLYFASPLNCYVYIFDIREGKSGKKKGFLLLNNLVEGIIQNKMKENVNNGKKIETHSQIKAEDNLDILQKSIAEKEFEEKIKNEKDEEVKKVIRVLVAGGDGTVMWCMKELYSHNIKTENVAIGVVPYGTGNDFANAFGWTKLQSVQPFDLEMKTLRNLLIECMSASVCSHDLWKVEISVCENHGYFTKIDTHTKKKQVLYEEGEENIQNDKQRRELKRMSFMMSNYFSMGIESRIGRGFDRNRTKSQFCNKVRYAIEGMKKIYFKRTVPIDKIVDRLVKNYDTDNETVVFTTSKNADGYPKLKRTMCLVALNIPSFSAGNDIWKTTKKIGIETDDKNLRSEILKEVQQTGDAKLEFISFKHAASIGLEFAFKGQGNRIHKSGGPWKIYFIKNLSENTRVYFQVDGEFFHMSHPKEIILKHYQKIFVLSSQKNKK